MTTPTMYVTRLTSAAILPAKGSALAAGFDLAADFTSHDDPTSPIQIAPGARRLIKTGLSIAIPADTYARVAPRSGLAFKHGIDVMAGVIDADYRGEVGVILINLGDQPFTVNPGDRIAQLVIEKIVHLDVAEVSELDSTARGAGGYGSTGV